MTLWKRENTRNLKRKHWVAVCGELALEETVGMSWDRDKIMADDDDGGGGGDGHVILS
jgi:hypothetical protein